MNDPVNHPSHYTDVVPGIECIEVTQHFSFLRGNAIKYLWRAGAKGNLREDLEKARWYINRELANLDPEKPTALLEFPEETELSDLTAAPRSAAIMRPHQ